MRRRDFVTLVGGAAAAWPLEAHGQQDNPLRRVGLLMSGAETDFELTGLLAVFVQGLRSLGWIEGQNLRTDVCWTAGDAERERTFATELLRLSPNVIFALTTPNLTALLRQGPVMIVFVQVKIDRLHAQKESPAQGEASILICGAKTECAAYAVLPGLLPLTARLVGIAVGAPQRRMVDRVDTGPEILAERADTEAALMFGIIPIAGIGRRSNAKQKRRRESNCGLDHS
jgi:hypothetical protein